VSEAETQRPGPAGAQRHLVHVFSTFAPGGPQVRTVDVMNRLGPRFRHTVLATNNDLRCRERIAREVPVAFAEVDRPPGRGVNRRALLRQLRALRPDLVLTYNWGAIDAVLVAGLARVSLVLHAEDGFGPDERSGQLARRKWARRAVLRLAEAVVVPSRNLERIAQETWWLPPRRVLYVANGIDVVRFSPGDGSALRRTFGIPEGALVVGSVMHLRSEKNPARCVRVFARGAPPGSFLVLVGDGPEKPALEKLAAELGVAERVRFAGFFADPAPAYRAFDVFALSSDTEQMPMSLLEAMAVGLPVAATDVGDVKSIVASANAPHVVPSDDENAFASSLAMLAARADLRRALGDANRARCASHFSLEQQTNAYADLYARFSGTRREAWRSEHYR